MSESENKQILYLQFTLDMTEEAIRRRFVERFGVEPKKIERITKGKIKGKEWGWWDAGPVPTIEAAVEA